MENQSCDYYSSDEEIAWGRLTLREIKKDLSTARKITRRKSDTEHSLYFTPSTTFSEKVEEHENISSATSSYFTPNVSVNKKDAFLENLAKLINSEDCEEKSYEVNDTLMGILSVENAKECILDNVEQTLMENTVRSPNVAESHHKIPTCITEDSHEEDSIITISDDSSYSSHESFDGDPHICVKMENKSAGEDIRHDLSDTNEVEETGNRIQAINLNLPKFDISGLGPLFTESTVTDNEKEKEVEKLQSGNLSEHNFVTSGLDMSNTENTTVDEETTQNVSLESYKSNTDTENSHGFNDTLEELEMLMKFGFDQQTPRKEESLTSSLTPSKQQNQKAPGIPVLKRTAKFNYIQSPVGDYIRKKSPPKQETFKVPIKPLKSKVTTPNTKSPLVQFKQYKNVISPIGVYIKNSPAACLKQNIPTKTIPVLKPSSKSSVQQNKENVGLPEVKYKSAQRVLETVHRDVVLPNNIRSLLPEPMVAVREAKIGNRNDRTLCDGDLTLMNATLNQTEQNISIVNTMQAFIK